jgi:hypothetical protein
VADYSLVQAGFGAPTRQNRWKVAFRFILAIPLELWLVVLSIVATILVVIGWFAALFMGRLPNSIARFLSDFLIFVTRVYSYIFLMNDAYPPFSAHDDFGVNLDIPISKVRRLAVLFRYFLLLPAFIVLIPLSFGLEICSVFVWLIVLVKGEMPLPLFGAVAATLRFEARVGAYAMMLTGKYPGELFGEKAVITQDLASPHSDAVADADPLPPPVHVQMTEPGSEGLVDNSALTAPSANDQGISFGSAPAPTGAPMIFSGEGTPSATSAPPRTARLVLSRGSKRILVAFLIIGALGYVGYAVLGINTANNQSALLRLNTANTLLNSEVATAKAKQSTCTSGQVTCAHQYFVSIYVIFNGFQVTLDGTTFPSSVRPDANRFEHESAKFVTLLNAIQRESAITPTQVTQLDNLGSAWDSDFNQVLSDLSSPI